MFVTKQIWSTITECQIELAKKNKQLEERVTDLEKQLQGRRTSGKRMTERPTTPFG